MIDKALSRRARELEETNETVSVEPVSEEVLEGLRRALLDGETHYTDRPGMKALRERIAEKLGWEADDIVITAGEKEARYVIALSGASAPVVDIGERLTPGEVAPGSILVGTLDSLPGLRSFRVAFIAAPADLAPALKPWKQALSICTAAPSQRTALLLERSFSTERLRREPAANATGRAEPRGWGPAALHNEDEKRYSLMELAATLDDVISLGRGDPDLATPPHIIEEAVRRMRNPVKTIDVAGIGELRAAIARRYLDDKGLDFDPDSEILVTNGAQEGLFLTVLALLDPGETILVPDPRYGSYDRAIATAGAERVALPTVDGYDFGLTPEAVEAHAGGAKVLLLVNPSNPTGALTPPERVRAISEVALEHNLIVISDEVYEKLNFDGGEVLSVVSCDGIRERTVTLSSLSKSYAMTGFRVGYLIGPEPFIDAARRLKARISGPTALFSQYAALAAIEGPQVTIETFRRIFQSRLEVMTRGLDRLGIPYGKPGGGFFVWADVSRFGLDAESFCRRLLTEARVLVFPGTAFGERWKDYARISLLQTEEVLEEALRRIESFTR